jgi:hypothetical protein
MMYGLSGNVKNFEMGRSLARMTPIREPKPYLPKSTESENPEKTYGVDISTLIRGRFAVLTRPAGAGSACRRAA